MPRFVILYHETPTSFARASHYDLMLQRGEGLRTWAIPAPPTPGSTQLAEPLPDHRLAYLDYEGPVSGDRGSVSRWDSGQYLALEETASKLAVQLHGNRFQGIVVLERLPEAAVGWRLTCRA